MKFKFDPLIQRELDSIKEMGIPVSIERGKRHLHIRIIDRLVAVISNETNSNRRMALNCRKNIRNFIKENNLGETENA